MISAMKKVNHGMRQRAILAEEGDNFAWGDLGRSLEEGILF